MLLPLNSISIDAGSVFIVVLERSFCEAGWEERSGADVGCQLLCFPTGAKRSLMGAKFSQLPVAIEFYPRDVIRIMDHYE